MSHCVVARLARRYYRRVRDEFRSGERQELGMRADDIIEIGSP